MNDIQRQLLYASSLLMQRSEIVSDVYDIMLFTLCFSTPAKGAFLSVDGQPEYFDMVVGSYRTDRLGKKGGIKIWEYDVPPPGEKRLCKSTIWLYKAKNHNWLIGLNSENNPDESYIESIILASSIAIEHIRRKEQKIEGKDQLTGLFDRGTLFRDLEHLARVSNVKNIPLHLLFFDLNNFKTVNDVLGHETGDRVLASQAYEIRKQVSGLGNAYRYGGDEFCIVLCGLSDTKVKELARRIEIASEQAPGGISISGSIGIACYNGVETIEKFIKRADTQMYDQKRIKKGEKAECLS
jgi:diguanylate cyclase (GGDEF)-like protein